MKVEIKYENGYAIVDNLKFKKDKKTGYYLSTYIEGKRKISVGNRTRIFPGLRMEALKSGSIVIGSNTVIEQNVHITCASKISIGNDCSILANVLITDIASWSKTYESLSCFDGLLELYRITGDKKYLEATEKFYDILVT